MKIKNNECRKAKIYALYKKRASDEARGLSQKLIFWDAFSPLFEKDDILHIFLRADGRIDDGSRHEG